MGLPYPAPGIWRAGEPRQVRELQALPSLQTVLMKARPETFIITSTGERLCWTNKDYFIYVFPSS